MKCNEKRDSENTSSPGLLESIDKIYIIHLYIDQKEQFLCSCLEQTSVVTRNKEVELENQKLPTLKYFFI
jgi:hypothetical protein